LNASRAIAILFFLSGLTGLIYEVVWIRLFSLAFGQTSQALGTVLGVYLAGLALGAWCAVRFAKAYPGRYLFFYGLAETLAGIYALSTPWLIDATHPVLRALYGTGHGAMVATESGRILLCSAILLPATLLMGSSLPLLAGYCETRGRSSIQSLYIVNLAGASIGAVMSGFVLLPTLGYSRTLQAACVLNCAVGVAALWVGKYKRPQKSPEERVDVRAIDSRLATRTWVVVAFWSGLACMLHEVVWVRIYALLFGPTASTLSLVLAVFLVGLMMGAVGGRLVRRDPQKWLCAAQFCCVGLLFWAFMAAGTLPQRIAAWVQLYYGSASQIEWMKAVVLTITLLPLTTIIGVSFPLMMRIAPTRHFSLASRVGGIYGINTTGCIVGALGTAWLLVPVLGTQATLLLGALINLALGVLLLQPGRRNLALVAAAAGVLLAIFLVPRWDMTAMTAGTYKYAPYYAASEPAQLTGGNSLFLREGSSGTVAVRKEGSSLVLSIDGKVDASDAGGDLLTEKLLAHLPLALAADAKHVCLIGLASGVTAGAMLTHPIQLLDVLEISPEIVTASHFFDNVNRKPLEDPRTSLLVNDGRNHLELTSAKYDLIVSEPSNPWIAGMNSLFTRDFFHIAKSRLSGRGVFAQWFHIYNMPKNDLQSLLQAFVEVFPSAMLWQLNDGDVLLTGFANPPSPLMRLGSSIPSDALSNPRFLLSLYKMRDGDIRRFAGSVAPNMDDNSILEFHGQQDLHAQTDVSNADDLASFSKQPPPEEVQEVHDSLTSAELATNGDLFESAESFRSAFNSYQAAFRKDPASWRALAGMDRTARLLEERSAVLLALGLTNDKDNLQSRTEHALAKARSGDLAGAEFLFQENAEAHPTDSAARLNYGLFCLERNKYTDAVGQFQRAISLSPAYVPAYEAMAETYLRLHDAADAIIWSRRILQLDPNHEVAKQTLAALERGH
jgi:spermidine synthase